MAKNNKYRNVTLYILDNLYDFLVTREGLKAIAFNIFREDKKVSTYINMLIAKDLRERNLLKTDGTVDEEKYKQLIEENESFSRNTNIQDLLKRSG